MRRLTSTLLAALLLLLCGLDSAGAHGGQYRGPNADVPPGRREPMDATPPYPPPRRGRVPGPPVVPRPTGTDPQPSEPPSRGFEEWVFWYHHNALGLDLLKDRLYGPAPGTDPIFGRGQMKGPDGTTAMRVRAQKELLPAFLRVIAAKRIHQDIRAAAYIGLAKLSRDPAHIALLRKGLDKKQDLIVREAAALGLGLLRRASPGNQFKSETLDEVRGFLFQVFEDESHQARTRGFAALALGLLGDQPTAFGGKRAAATTARLFALLTRPYSHPDLPISLLMAIGLQPVASVVEAQRRILRDCVLGGRLGTHETSPFVRSFAPGALARVGVAADVPILERALAGTKGAHLNLRRGAAIGLGQLGRRLAGKARVQAADGLLRGLGTLQDPSAVHFSIMSLAQLIVTDVDEQKTEVFAGTKAGSVLLELAEKGTGEQRSFGALALARIAREIGNLTVIDVYGEYRALALKSLRKGLAATDLDSRIRAAFAVALGLTEDQASLRALAALVADKKQDAELRSYAALGLGVIGKASRDVCWPIRDALQERRSELLHLQSATALALLRDDEGERYLLRSLRQLEGSRKDTHRKGQIVLALARVGKEESLAPLIALLENEAEHDYVRATACASLGVIGDFEWQPSLWRLTRNLNYRAQPDLVSELLALL